jgi:mannan endo-1,4-beta-mannosidase
MRLPLLPVLKKAIDTYYPATKLAITEFNYGASDHVSGGLATADVLGIMGKYGVYMANLWGTIDGFVSSAYQLFRNYDGSFSTFGDLKVYTLTTDNASSSLYASLSSTTTKELHLILLNKNQSRTIEGTVTIAGPQTYSRAEVFGFNADSPTVKEFSSIEGIVNNRFVSTLPPLSARHIILNSNSTRVDISMSLPPSEFQLSAWPNPVHGPLLVETEQKTDGDIRLGIYNIKGELKEILWQGPLTGGRHRFEIQTYRWPTGLYFIKMEMPVGRKTVKVMLVR